MKQAKRFHPDTEGGDEKLFKEISEAYSTLSDIEEKMKYDTKIGNTAEENLYRDIK